MELHKYCAYVLDSLTKYCLEVPSLKYPGVNWLNLEVPSHSCEEDQCTHLWHEGDNEDEEDSTHQALHPLDALSSHMGLHSMVKPTPHEVTLIPHEAIKLTARQWMGKKGRRHRLACAAYSNLEMQGKPCQVTDSLCSIMWAGAHRILTH
jgi:hypothetical protein